MTAISNVFKKNPSMRFGDLKDRHWQFIANRFPHLPLKGESLGSFKNAVQRTMTGVSYEPDPEVVNTGISGYVSQSDGGEESDSTESDSFTESDAEAMSVSDDEEDVEE